MIKALNKNLQIRMSERMYQNIEELAVHHGTTASRIIRSGLWLFLRTDPKRMSALQDSAMSDKQLVDTLANLDHLDIGLDVQR